MFVYFTVPNRNSIRMVVCLCAYVHTYMHMCVVFVCACLCTHETRLCVLWIKCVFVYVFACIHTIIKRIFRVTIYNVFMCVCMYESLSLLPSLSFSLSPTPYLFSQSPPPTSLPSPPPPLLSPPQTTTSWCCSSDRRWLAGVIVLTADAARTAGPILIQVEGVWQQQFARSLYLLSCWLFFVQKLHVIIWKGREGR